MTAARRFASQLLTGSTLTDPVAIVQRILAVQAQDLVGARLAVRARSAPGSLTAADVDACLDAGQLVVSWLNRGTLHLVTPADHRLLHPLTTPQLAVSNRRRLAQEGVCPEQAERGVEVVVRALREHGPLGRNRLRDHLDAAGVPTAGQALVHVLFAVTLRGLVVRGPFVGGEHAFTLLSEPVAGDPDARLPELGRRYLAGHAPADATDLARWAGITLGRARRALPAAPDPAAGDGDGPLPTRLLGPFDPVLHGWPDRSWVVGPHTGVVTVNGIFRHTALVRGRVVGTWGLPGGVVTLTLLEPVADDDLAALADDARDVLRFLARPERELVVHGPPA